MLNSGKLLKHFKIISLIGKGGMGEVYLAEDTVLNRKVAIKVLLEDAFDNREKQQRFTREAKTAAVITHPNVMRIYEIGTGKIDESDQEINYIAMEYIEGQSLSEYINQKSPNFTEIIKLAEKISAGLSAAHKLNIVHRDIKADNIIIDEYGEPKILDFGLAKPVEGVDAENNITDTVDKELTQAGKIIGTVSYMSPEQAKGDTVDTRSDIFSFGVLLYRMVTSEFPFSGPTQVSTIARILESQYDAPRDKNPAIPTELERIIEKTLRKDPNDRYQDTRDLVVDLRNLRRQFDSGVTDTLSSELDTSKVYTKKITLSNKLVSIISAIAVIVIAAIFINQYWGGGTAEITPSVQAKSNSLAILGFENKTGDVELSWLETGLPEILLTDLAQSDILQIISRERVIDCLPPDKRENHTYDECVKVARDLGALHLLSGSFYKMGDKIRIDARLEDATTGNVIKGIKVIGDDPFLLVDSLTQKIASNLNLSSEKFASRNVKSMMSSSPEAYQSYLEGIKLYQMELLDDAIEKFKNAIELDTSFAMAYLRIGMSYVFDNKQQEGLPYFEEAIKRVDNLPVREKLLLDIYTDTWVKKEYNKAFVKMESFVTQYPDDKEAHTIYGLFAWVFSADSALAFEHYEAALKLDPTYQFALSSYSQVYRNLKNYEKALEYSQKIKEYHPDSPESYFNLGRIYTLLLRYDDAIEEYNAVLKMNHDIGRAYRRLSELSILVKDFDKVDYYIEKSKESSNDDPYELYYYYLNKSNLADWRGQFKKSLEYYHDAVKTALEIKDSMLIRSVYSNLASEFYRFQLYDSSFHYRKIESNYAEYFNNFSYEIAYASHFANADGVRDSFYERINIFRSKLPPDLYFFADLITDVFEGYASADTQKVINAFREIDKSPVGKDSENINTLGKLLILTGNYEEGIRTLNETVKGENETTDGFTYIENTYYLALGYENIGNIAKAREHYQTVLKYWSEPDYQLDFINDAKVRLGNLTG